MIAASALAIAVSSGAADAECPWDGTEIDQRVRAIEGSNPPDPRCARRPERMAMVGYILGRLTDAAARGGVGVRACMEALHRRGRQIAERYGDEARVAYSNAFLLGSTGVGPEIAPSDTLAVCVRDFDYRRLAQTLERQVETALAEAAEGEAEPEDSGRDDPLSDLERSMVGRWLIVRSVEPDGRVLELAEASEPYIYDFSADRRAVYTGAGVTISGAWRLLPDGRLSFRRDDGTEQAVGVVELADASDRTMVWRGDDGTRLTLLRLGGE